MMIKPLLSESECEDESERGFSISLKLPFVLVLDLLMNLTFLAASGLQET
jgi:hypothetical protein